MNIDDWKLQQIMAGTYIPTPQEIHYIACELYAYRVPMQRVATGGVSRTHLVYGKL